MWLVMVLYLLFLLLQWSRKRMYSQSSVCACVRVCYNAAVNSSSHDRSCDKAPSSACMSARECWSYISFLHLSWQRRLFILCHWISRTFVGVSMTSTLLWTLSASSCYTHTHTQWYCRLRGHANRNRWNIRNSPSFVFCFLRFFGIRVSVVTFQNKVPHFYFPHWLWSYYGLVYKWFGL